MKVCRNCTLNDRIFSVKINEDGLCNYCLQSGGVNNHSDDEDYAAKETQLAEAFAQHRDRPYQVLLAYSGGKDSTYTLYKLRETFGVSVLAVTFDNGFLTEQCRRNIHEVTSCLDVDSITIKHSFSKLAAIFNLASSKEIFPKKALERASSICTACIGLVKAAVYKEAILRKIPFVCFGWTPGQAQVKSPIIKLDYRMLMANNRQIQEPVRKNLGEAYLKYFLEPDWVELHKEDIPSFIYPLVFSYYDEDEILSTIGGLGWKRPPDTDMNSTNCLLNSYANFVHMRDYGFNPYCLEIAGLVRGGFLSREEGLKKLAASGDQSVIDFVSNELNRRGTD